MKKETLHLPVQIMTVTCPDTEQCGMTFSVIGILGTDWNEETTWAFQDVDFCPYCGKRMK